VVPEPSQKGKGLIKNILFEYFAISVRTSPIFRKGGDLYGDRS
jgi:hypothetical protein